MMTTAKDVAAYIVEKYGSVDKLQIQKLLYYVQAWNLTWTGRPAFDDKIKAWKYGPIVPELNMEITERNQGFAEAQRNVVREIPGGVSSSLSSDLTDIVDSVYSFYGHLTGPELIDITHKESAWVIARGDLAEGETSNMEITLGMMRKFHGDRVLNGAEGPRRPQLRVTQASDDEFKKAFKRMKKAWKETERRLVDR